MMNYQALNQILSMIIKDYYQNVYKNVNLCRIFCLITVN